MITAAHAKEALCRSYIIAVASACRQNLWLRAEFDYGVDGQFKLVEQRGPNIRETAYGFEFQAKASVNWTVDSGTIKYDLDAVAYNDLADRAGRTNCVPFFLILLCLPPDEATWSYFSDESLTLRRCAYFLQVRGPLTQNSSTHRIEIPLTNALTPAAVLNILNGIKSGAIQP